MKMTATITRVTNSFHFEKKKEDEWNRMEKIKCSRKLTGLTRNDSPKDNFEMEITEYIIGK